MYKEGKVENMNILERALLYLKRKKIKSMLLFLTLTVITSGLLIGMVVWKGSRDEMKELQMTYRILLIRNRIFCLR